MPGGGIKSMLMGCRVNFVQCPFSLSFCCSFRASLHVHACIASTLLILTVALRYPFSVTRIGTALGETFHRRARGKTSDSRLVVNYSSSSSLSLSRSSSSLSSSVSAALSRARSLSGKDRQR